MPLIKNVSSTVEKKEVTKISLHAKQRSSSDGSQQDFIFYKVSSKLLFSKAKDKKRVQTVFGSDTMSQ